MSELDPQTARILRKKRAQAQADFIGRQQQQDQPSQHQINKAPKNNRQQRHRPTQKSLKSQIQYFGNKIQPFNMRQQQQLGNMDGQGFFVFNRGKQKRDAWLDSVRQGDEEEVVDQMVKKIKESSRFKSVYQGENYNSRNKGGEQQQEDQRDDDSYQGGGIKQAQQSQQQDQQDKNTFKIQQLIQLIIQQIPQNSNANNYMKKLKKDKKMEQYNKLLTISNLYIEKTGQYDILTKKKQELQDMLQELFQKKRENNKLKSYQNQEGNNKEDGQGQGQEEELIGNWDDEDQQYSQQQRKLQQQKALEEQNKKVSKQQVSEGDQSQSQNKSDDNDDDNIF